MAKLGKISIAVFVIVGLTPMALPAADSPTATVSVEDCRRLVAYQPSEGVNYQPGVDVHGRAVAPADLNDGSQITLPKSFAFPLDFTPIRERGFRQSRLNLGEIEVDQNGQAYFDGKPLHNGDQAALSRKCQEVLNRS